MVVAVVDDEIPNVADAGIDVEDDEPAMRSNDSAKVDLYSTMLLEATQTKEMIARAL